MGWRGALIIAVGLWAAAKLLSGFFDDDDDTGPPGSQSPRPPYDPYPPYPPSPVITRNQRPPYSPSGSPAAPYEHLNTSQHDNTTYVPRAEKISTLKLGGGRETLRAPDHVEYRYVDTVLDDRHAHQANRAQRNIIQHQEAVPQVPPKQISANHTKLPSRQRFPTTVQPLHDFLPIEDRECYEKARDEARRLTRVKEKYISRKCLAESSENEDDYLVNLYDNEIRAQTEAIEALNGAASAWIFRENNRRGKVPSGSVDLHKLRVPEAIDYAKKAAEDAKMRGDERVRLIVGQGKHSEGGVSKLKPAVMGALKAQDYNVHVDPKNAGALIVLLE